jgi:pimeloyl-ACP methyl ester carboxylesterase
LGHSQGGVIAGMLAGYYHDVIHKLVMLSPAASLKTDAQRGVCMQAAYDPDHIPAYVNVDGTHEVGGLYFRMAQMLPIYEVTSRFGGKALAVLGGEDIVVSPAAIERYGQTMQNCRVLSMKTLDHGLMGDEHEALMKQILNFLTKP